MSDEKELTYLDALYGMVTNPFPTLKKVTDREKLSWSLLTFFGVQLFSLVLSFNLTRSSSLPENLPREIPPHLVPPLMKFMEGFTFIGGIIGILMGVVLWFVASGVLALIAQFFGGSGNGKRLFIALGFTSVPVIFSSLFNFIFRVTGVTTLLGFLTGLAVFIWTIFLDVLAVKATQGLNTAKALAVVLLPGLMVVGVVAFIIFIFIFSLIPLFQQFPAKFPII
ncbi:MAG: hypothetical protein PWQ96_1188 [Clostridia bacterium]|nr:hypothetical protein [Clostridiales bacterium]MDK2985546.1 hypothetical protein [Clostridia bacterium]